MFCRLCIAQTVVYRRLLKLEKRSPCFGVPVQFVAAADQLLSSLSPELFAAAPDTDIIFLLGTSPMRPQEIYSITCSTGSSASQSVEIKSEQSSPSYSATAAKVVLRKLTLATAAGPEGPASKGEGASLTSKALTHPGQKA